MIAPRFCHRVATFFSVPLLVYQAQTCVEKGQTLDLARTLKKHKWRDQFGVLPTFLPSPLDFRFLRSRFTFFAHVIPFPLPAPSFYLLVPSFTSVPLQYALLVFFCGFSSFLLCLSFLSSCSIPLTRLSGCSFCWLPLLHFSILLVCD